MPRLWPLVFVYALGDGTLAGTVSMCLQAGVLYLVSTCVLYPSLFYLTFLLTNLLKVGLPLKSFCR